MEKERNDITLAEWLEYYRNDEDLRVIFVNMDKALKYIHMHGYCIEVFYPTEIYILNEELDHIQFRKLIELSSDPNTRQRMINEDIFNSAFLQIGIYSNSLPYLKPEFLKENFDSFTTFLPAGDVSYYRGVIQRGAKVYFAEFDLEKRKRDLEELEKQFNESGEDKSFEKKKLLDTNNLNEKVNDVIYRQINGMKDSAFISYLLIPTIILSLLCLISLIIWGFSLI